MRTGPVFLLLTLAVVTAGALPAQTPEEEVMATVQRLFDGMRAADSAMVRSTFDREARFIRVVTRQDEPARVVAEPVDRFVAAVANVEEVWDERLHSPQVRVDGAIASVWTEYSFYLGERFSHCGVDSIELARTADGWKITQLADTRRREGCPN